MLFKQRHSLPPLHLQPRRMWSQQVLGLHHNHHLILNRLAGDLLQPHPIEGAKGVSEREGI